jgi:hypothetical protein
MGMPKWQTEHELCTHILPPQPSPLIEIERNGRQLDQRLFAILGICEKMGKHDENLT